MIHAGMVLVVTQDFAKVQSGVRFPLPAPFLGLLNMASPQVITRHFANLVL
jgi:hypothetical protein